MNGMIHWNENIGFPIHRIDGEEYVSVIDEFMEVVFAC